MNRSTDWKHSPHMNTVTVFPRTWRWLYLESVGDSETRTRCTENVRLSRAIYWTAFAASETGDSL